MTVYAWNAAWRCERFEMRVLPNTRVFVGPYTPATQVVDFMGERWIMNFDLPGGIDQVQGAALEAFFDRLKGPANQIQLWNMRRPVPQGTLRDGLTASVVNASLAAVTVQNASAVTVPTIYGTPSVQVAVAQLANTATLTAVPGYTLKAGDHIGINGQNVRLMADALADGSGNMAIEFMPRARAAWDVGLAVTWNKPTLNLILKGDGVPVTHRAGMFEGMSLDLIETY